MLQLWAVPRPARRPNATKMTGGLDSFELQKLPLLCLPCLLCCMMWAWQAPELHMCTKVCACVLVCVFVCVFVPISRISRACHFFTRGGFPWAPCSMLVINVVVISSTCENYIHFSDINQHEGGGKEGGRGTRMECGSHIGAYLFWEFFKIQHQHQSWLEILEPFWFANKSDNAGECSRSYVVLFLCRCYFGI